MASISGVDQVNTAWNTIALSETNRNTPPNRCIEIRSTMTKNSFFNNYLVCSWGSGVLAPRSSKSFLPSPSKYEIRSLRAEIIVARVPLLVVFGSGERYCTAVKDRQSLKFAIGETHWLFLKNLHPYTRRPVLPLWGCRRSQANLCGVPPHQAKAVPP